MSEHNEKRRVLLGVTGSIAAYKAAEVARMLMSRNYEVRVVMSQAATEFVSPLTFESITGKKCASGFWEGSEGDGIEHIELADWADVFAIAPATADTLAKLRIGAAESSLLAIALATKAPLLVAPAMNVNMLQHAATQENLTLLKERGVEVIEPEVGVLACGWSGAGRLASPSEIYHRIRRALSNGDFCGKRVVVTTGPTREAIDPIRFISNRSSGKMGVAVAMEAYRRGARVTLVHGPVPVEISSDIEAISVVSAEDMETVVLREVFDSSDPADVVVMAAAVSDFRPTQSQGEKIKKAKGFDSIALTENPDILSTLGERRGDGAPPILVGFAMETGEIPVLLEEARRKLKEKNADMIVGNFAEEAFDLDTNRVWLIDRKGKQSEVTTTYKSRVANKILDSITKLV